jgi:hypothetical protein
MKENAALARIKTPTRLWRGEGTSVVRAAGRRGIVRLLLWISSSALLVADAAELPPPAARPVDPVKKHWAYESIERPAVRAGRSPHAAIRNPIDSFIAKKLSEAGLHPSPEADRPTLVRRLYLVLHGLPPAPEDVAAFVADRRSDAYERLVDQLLASPRYGERWGRHWLDVIPFGETHGFEVNTPRENAWPFRDYVIDAFNRDTPYPRFMMEQLAGDAMGADTATGFMVAAAALLPGQIGKDEESKLIARQDELNAMVAGVGGAFLGLTLHCARCHDHKFDPVTQLDYYAVQAIFAGVRHGERPVPTPDWNERQKEAPVFRAQLDVASRRLFDFEPLASVGGSHKTFRVPVQARMNVEHFAPVRAQRLRFTISATSENSRREPCLDELEVFTASPQRRNVALATAGAIIRASTNHKSARYQARYLNDGVYGNDQSWISDQPGKGWIEVEFAQPETIDVVAWSRDRMGMLNDRLPVKYRVEVAENTDDWQVVATSDDRENSKSGESSENVSESPGPPGVNAADYRAAQAEVSALERKLQSVIVPPKVYAGYFEPPEPTYRLHRGEVTQRREPVQPDAVAFLGLPLSLTADASEQGRRVAFARWLGDPKNPLPARVLVNRLWQHHFGEGIVNTPSDFGRNGAAPIHPELLDWLASEFINSGWSIKHMQRLIVLSATWRQTSAPNSAATARDAASRLLWRFPPRRLEAEAIHDSMLAISGTLDLRMGGPGYSVFAPNSNYVRVYDPKAEYGPAEWRRMVYQTKVRMAQDSTFGAFDCPDAGQASPKRSRSTTPLQALNLFNSGFVLQQAEQFAARLQRDSGASPAAQVKRGFLLAFSRQPSSDEARTCEQLVRAHGLPALCRVLLNANEFLSIP